MSIYVNRATLALLNMTKEMYRKNIEISRITKTATLLLTSGLSKNDIDFKILERCLQSQNSDGGFVSNTDTIWNIKLFDYYPELHAAQKAAISWLKSNNGIEPGFGRSKRDMHRIPVTGLALYLIPELADERSLQWLKEAWLLEKNSLTYKAAYTLLAFSQRGNRPNDMSLLRDTADWLVSQQQDDGGFAPWFNHPVGANVYCTAVAALALINTKVGVDYVEYIKRAYYYLCATQLKSGIWPYHEIEDGAAWGLLAMSQAECFLGI